MKKTYSHGFTLIELLVVIAIIGILASVVLASLNTARNKGRASAIKEEMVAARSQAAIFFDTNGNYTNICGAVTGGIGSIKADIESKNGGIQVWCPANSLAWAFAATLPTNPASYWCVDSTGVSRGTTAGGATYTAQDGSVSAALMTSTTTNCN